ncbi:excinuclease ABC subunit UvrC [Gallaecimonas kandeliae]|uniref:excinuclease ABC subunit UvrC n=1 Tax=Gallaecimonas kandeliae TaxID=3029055 RepID=UPI0026480183|nr:excinuclease ABC subunit UvrC [Gallaecimonas kandeliae]WKE67273.1 excinuclease ABC subunit UvrC [Gallaecimonas kandeliae]
MFDHKAFLKHLTSQPGVYRMFDVDGTVIYVGKAKDLKKRVSSYFTRSQHSAKTVALVANIANIEVTVTNTETEALILENHLIKAHRPKYNVLLRDDKGYPYILVSGHQHPRIAVHRGARREKGDYFGPYPSAGAVRESLKLMQRLFPVRQCDDSYYKNRSRPCLQYQLKRCLAPCVAGYVTDQDYAEQVRLAKLFLSGKNQQVIAQLVARMEQAAQALDFEQAARLRDQIQALRKVQESQWVSGNAEELDVIACAERQGTLVVQVLVVRDNKVLGSRSYFPKLPRDTDLIEGLQGFLQQFYLGGLHGRQVPAEVILDRELPELDLLGEAVGAEAGRKVQFRTKVRGERRRYLELAAKNAATALDAQLAHKGTVSTRYKALKTFLALPDPIERMECFDISHTQGTHTVASNVVFGPEGPLKSDYRRFNIEGITPGDDYAAMAQAMARRFKSPDDNLPDILFIDGGKGQLAQAEAHFQDWPKPPLLVGVAKGVDRRAGQEVLILGYSHKELTLPPDSPALHLVQHIRDESHRFAITGHRGQRAKAGRTSTLENIEGVGPKKRQALLKYLGGLQQVRAASIDELTKVPGISRALAEKIHATLHSH